MHTVYIAMTVYDNKKKINQSRDYLKYTMSCYAVDTLTYKIIVIMPVGTKTATAIIIIVEYHLL